MLVLVLASLVKTRLNTLRLESEESNPKPSIWLTLGLELDFRRRVSQIEGFGLLSSFSSLRQNLQQLLSYNNRLSRLSRGFVAGYGCLF